MADVLVSEHAVELLVKIESPAVVSEQAIETAINLSIEQRTTQHVIEYAHQVILPAVLIQHVIEYVPVPPTPTLAPKKVLVRRLRRSPIVSQEDLLLIFDAFEVDLQAGIGNVTDPGLDPTVVLQYSDDGGITWSDEYRLSAGPMGDYIRQVKWTRLGPSRNRVFQIWCTDPCFWVVIGAYLEMKKGRF